MAKTARVHPAVRERLDELPAALQKEFGVSAGPEEIVGALLHGVTLGQLAGMLDAFHRYTAVYETGTPANYQKPPAIS
jgi:hypothetical protein